MTRQRVRAKDYRSMRNLAQYKDLTDEEFLEKMELRDVKKATEEAIKKENTKSISERAEEKLAEFEKDYDLSDLKYNDREALDSLINATIMLEDLELQIHEIQQAGIDTTNLTLIDKLNKMASDLRSDIIKSQDSLMITRKIRKSGTEESLLTYMEKVQLKAKEFYESRMSYIYCPECKMLLCTAWFLYPYEKKNTIRLVCNRTIEDGEEETICGTEVIVTTEELMQKRSKNIDDVPNV